MEVTVEIDNKVKDISINIYYFKDKYKLLEKSRSFSVYSAL